MSSAQNVIKGKTIFNVQIKLYNECMLFQNVIALVLNTIYKITNNINDRIKKRILYVLLCILSLSYLSKISVNKSWFFSIDRNFFIVIVLLLLIVFYINNSIKKCRFNLYITIPYYISAFGILIFGYINSMISQYYYLAFEMIFIFPCFWLIENSNKEKYLFEYLSYSSTTICNLYYLYCFYLAYHGEFCFCGGRVVASTSNANQLAFFYLVGFLGSIYLVCKNSKSIIKLLYGFTSASVSLLFILLALCRSAQIVVFLVCFAVVCFITKTFNKENYKCKTKRILKKILVGIAIFIIIYNSKNVLFDMQRRKSSEVINININEISNRYEKQKFDTSSSIYVRLNVWRTYLKRINLTGHPYGELSEEDFYPVPMYEPHNNYIDITYKFGILTGLTYSLWIIEIGIIVIKKIFYKKENEIGLIYIICFSIGFAILSMVDMCVVPYSTDIVTIFYLLLSRLIVTKE